MYDNTFDADNHGFVFILFEHQNQHLQNGLRPNIAFLLVTSERLNLKRINGY